MALDHATGVVDAHQPELTPDTAQERRDAGFSGSGASSSLASLDDQQAERLAALARDEGRSQAEILREAIAAYRPRSSQDRSFALAAGFARIDDDPRPISAIPEHELLDGFGS